MFRVRWQADRQRTMFQKFHTMGLAAQFAAHTIARCNGPLMLRITLNGEIVYDFERP